MSKRFVLLSTDAIHHTYFINKVLAEGIELAAVFHETESVQPKFLIGPVFDDAQKAFEDEAFCRDLPREVPEDLPVFYYPCMNDPAAIEHIAQYEPEIGVVFGCGKLKPPVIRLFPTLLNIHKGFAEEYRGLDTDLWPIYHGEPDRIGVTVHQVEEELDTGAIAKMAQVPLYPGMKIEELRYAWVILATEMVINCLREFADGKLDLAKQSQVGRYYSFMPIDLKRIVARRFNRYCEGLKS